jgi:hypothetical protein
MCFCESDAVKILIHVKTRQRYPGIAFHEETLARVAAEFGIESTQRIRQMCEEELQILAAAVLRYLPAHACPSSSKTAAR